MARAQEIKLSKGLDQAARQLGKTSSLIGSALRLLTDDAENQATLKTSLATLTRVLDGVQWHTISKGDPDAWLYFYENFLETCDNALRKKTGSYYTPPGVVGPMVRLVDEVLRSRFALQSGFASSSVTVADPAVGTGTFLLGILPERVFRATVERHRLPRRNTHRPADSHLETRWNVVFWHAKDQSESPQQPHASIPGVSSERTQTATGGGAHEGRARVSEA